MSFSVAVCGRIEAGAWGVCVREARAERMSISASVSESRRGLNRGATCFRLARSRERRLLRLVACAIAARLSKSRTRSSEGGIDAAARHEVVVRRVTAWVGDPSLGQVVAVPASGDVGSSFSRPVHQRLEGHRDVLAKEGVAAPRSASLDEQLGHPCDQAHAALVLVDSCSKSDRHVAKSLAADSPHTSYPAPTCAPTPAPTPASTTVAVCTATTAATATATATDPTSATTPAAAVTDCGCCGGGCVTEVEQTKVRHEVLEALSSLLGAHHLVRQRRVLR